jgi:Tol biopolymer transport system component/ribosomal protein L24E
MLSHFRGTPPNPLGVRRRPRLVGVLTALALAVAPALPIGNGAQAATAAPTKGYWFVAADGGIFSFGDASFAGSTGNLKLNQPIVGMSPSPTGRGYWFVAADGGVFSFGDAKFFGSTGNVKLNRPIVGMAPSPTGGGYWFVAADGGIFSFGDAKFFGSTGAVRLAKPIVGMAATPTGKGYWFVASDGGVFNFGDAKFHGSAGASNLRSPIVGMASTPSGQGYYLAAADGTVVAFGDAAFRGSMGGKSLKSPIVGIAPTSTGGGYWLVAADGGIFSFGDAAFYGSTGALKLNRAIVGMAAAPQKTTGPTSPGGGPLPTTPGGGTSPTTPGGGTTPTTIPAPNFDWGDPGSTLLVNISNRPLNGGGNAYRPWMSDNGRYLVFDSDGKRVIAGTVDPDPGIRDIYLYDREMQSIERISWGMNGLRANIPDAGNCANPCGSQRPTISADGRFVAFWSSADNLVPGDTNEQTDAFLYDRQKHTMTLVSKGFNGAQANGESRRPVVSRDGNFVVFESAASNITPTCGILDLNCKGDKNNADDVFLYEVGTGSVTLVSGAANGATANGASNRPSLSGNGRRIVYQSTATNLVASDTNNDVMDVFMRDASGVTSVVSTGAQGQGDKNSGSPSMSADGRWVSFDSKATKFVDGDTGGDVDIFVKDVDGGGLDQVSVRTGGGQATGTNGSTVVGGDSSISSDGRFVAFWSNATTLVDGDNNGTNCKNYRERQPPIPCADVFVRDRVLGTTTRIVSTTNAEGDEDSFSPALSMDGRVVAFDSKANSLDSTATANNLQDIYVHVNF